MAGRHPNPDVESEQDQQDAPPLTDWTSDYQQRRFLSEEALARVLAVGMTGPVTRGGGWHDAWMLNPDIDAAVARHRSAARCAELRSRATLARQRSTRTRTRERRSHRSARRVASRSSGGGSDGPSSSDPPPPDLHLWRHPDLGLVSRDLYALLLRVERSK